VAKNFVDVDAAKKGLILHAYQSISDVYQHINVQIVRSQFVPQAVNVDMKAATVERLLLAPRRTPQIFRSYDALD